jgi:hypothetical protein
LGSNLIVPDKYIIIIILPRSQERPLSFHRIETDEVEVPEGSLHGVVQEDGGLDDSLFDVDDLLGNSSGDDLY